MEITSKHLQDNAVTYALQNAKSNRNVKDGWSDKSFHVLHLRSFAS